MIETPPEMNEAEQKEHERLTCIANEIEAVLAKHDLAGHVCLVSESLSHYLYKFDASWSAASIVDSKVQMKCTQEQGYTPEQVKQRVTATVRMFAGMMHILKNDQQNIMSIMLALASKFDIMNIVSPVDDAVEVEEEQA